MKMEHRERQAHWDQIYTTRATDEVSWYQERPGTSLALIEEAGLEPSARILDVGGGHSSLVDHLVTEGYQRLGVLDVSEAAVALTRARVEEQFGERAKRVEWFVADVTMFASPHRWDLWHDRAVFHFLTDPEEQARYLQVLHKTLAPEGQVVIGTFGPQGPERCSGLPVERYDAERLQATFGPSFELAGHRLDTHTTPGGASQQFLFARFVRRR